VKRERDLEIRLRSLETLGEAVGAMKSLSAHHFRESRLALAPAHAYRDGIERALQSTGASLPAGDGAHGLLVIGAELGFCGGYNSSVVAAAAERRAALGDGPTLCVGRRAATLLGRRGVRIDRSYRGPTSVVGIADTLLKVTQDMLGDYLEQRLSAFEAVANRFEGVGAHRSSVTALLPMAKPSDPSAPRQRYADRDHVAAVAVRELLYSEMVDLLLDALAAEHGARLAATQAAEHWLNERTARLRRHLSAARREASTQEVVEIAAGARARARAFERGAVTRRGY
jgi:F-type H+-transporting ATPase subunit gamma